MKYTNVLSLTLVLLSLIMSSCGGKSAEDYNSVGEFINGYAVASYNGTNYMLRYVLVNEDYEPVTEEMKSIDIYSEEFWIAETLDGKCASIDKMLNVTPIACQSPYKRYLVSSNTILANNSEGDLVLVDLKTGNQLGKAYPNCTIDQVLSNGTVVLRHQKRSNLKTVADGYAMIDAKGEELAPLGKFTFIGDFNNGLAAYSTSGYGIPISRSRTEYSQENTVNGNGNAKWFELGDKYGNFGDRQSDKYTQGYIDEKGMVVIPQRFAYAQPFDDNGFAIVGGFSKPIRGLWGYYRDYSKIDKSGKVVATNLKLKRQRDCTLAEN